jgi:hypothetical protein
MTTTEDLGNNSDNQSRACAAECGHASNNHYEFGCNVKLDGGGFCDCRAPFGLIAPGEANR